MADTTTPVLGLVKQTIGGNRNTWGAILNSCMDLIEGAFYGLTSVAVTGAGDVTLTDTQRRKRILVFSGTLAADQNIIIANLVGRWTVRNATTGAFKLKIKTPSGTAVEIPQGGYSDVWCDGADAMFVGLSTRLRDTQMLAPDGTASAPGQSWATETKSGILRVSEGVFAWIINEIARLTLSATAFYVSLDEAGALTVTINDNQIVEISETGVAITQGALTVNGQTPVPIGAEMDYGGIYEPNGWKFKNGQALSRTVYADYMEVLTVTANATRNGTTTISVDKNLTGLGLEGSQLEGAGIASGTTIVAIGTGGIGLSQAASGSGSMEIRIFPHGRGDGSTTFNVPDDQGRTRIGREGMGGATAPNRVTLSGSGINAQRLGVSGGSETVILTASQIAAHTHSATVNDPGHSHQILFGTTTSGAGGSNTLQSSQGNPGSPTYPSLTNTTGISVTINANSGGQAHQNVQPSRVTNTIVFTGVYT